MNASWAMKTIWALVTILTATTTCSLPAVMFFDLDQYWIVVPFASIYLVLILGVFVEKQERERAWRLRNDKA